MPSELVEVTQADRDAASDWCASQPFPSKQAEAPMIRSGEYDHHSLVQAFARHRLAERERCAMLATKGVVWDGTGNCCSATAEHIAHAIRNTDHG